MFITKDNHVVIMEQARAETGDAWAPLGEILLGINPMIPARVNNDPVYRWTPGPLW